MNLRSIRVSHATAVILLLLATGVAGACSSAATPTSDGGADGRRVLSELSAPEALPQQAPMDASGLVADRSTAQNGAAVDDALIIRTGTLELEVKDVAASLPQARALVVGLGGYVAASDESDYGDVRSATITYRIPVDRWQDAIDGLRGLGDKVVREATQAQEVTSQVVDLKARITNLRAAETALIDIMDKSGSIEDVLAVQQRLYDVRGEIEQLVAQQQELETRAALATLSVTWTSPVVAVAATAAGWDLGKVIDEAAAQTVAAGQWLVSGLVWLLVVGLPVLGVPLLLLAGLALIARRRLGGRFPDAPTTGPDGAQGGAAA